MTAKTPANAKPARATKAQEAADLRVMQNDIKHLDRWQYIMSYAIITGFALLLAVQGGTLLWVDTELGDMYMDMNTGFVELEGGVDAKFVKLDGRIDGRFAEVNDRFVRMDEGLDRQDELLLQMRQQTQQMLLQIQQLQLQVQQLQLQQLPGQQPVTPPTPRPTIPPAQDPPDPDSEPGIGGQARRSGPDR